LLWPIQRCGRLDDQIGLLRHKLYLIQQGLAFNGKRTKTARSQGKKFQVSVEQEATRLLVSKPKHIKLMLIIRFLFPIWCDFMACIKLIFELVGK
jgi:hypothetical protein